MNTLKEKLDFIRNIVDMEIADDIDSIRGKGARLSGVIGLSAECKKEAKGAMDEARLNALLHHTNESPKMGASILLKISESECSEQNADYVYADRLNAAVTHQLDHVRTLISLWKAEMENERRSAPYNT